MRSSFYNENTLRNLFFKPKAWVSTAGRNSIVRDIGWSICKAVHFGESKQSLELQSYEDLLKTGI